MSATPAQNFEVLSGFMQYRGKTYKSNEFYYHVNRKRELHLLELLLEEKKFMFQQVSKREICDSCSCCVGQVVFLDNSLLSVK